MKTILKSPVTLHPTLQREQINLKSINWDSYEESNYREIGTHPVWVAGRTHDSELDDA